MIYLLIFARSCSLRQTSRRSPGSIPTPATASSGSRASPAAPASTSIRTATPPTARSWSTRRPTASRFSISTTQQSQAGGEGPRAPDRRGRKTQRVYYLRDGAAFWTERRHRRDAQDRAICRGAAPSPPSTPTRRCSPAHTSKATARTTTIAARHDGNAPHAGAFARSAPQQGPDDGGALGRAPADGAVHAQRQDRRNQDHSQSQRLAEPSALLAHRSNAADVLPRRPVAQGGPHLDDPHRRHASSKKIHTRTMAMEICGPRVLERRRQDHLVRPADAARRGFLAGRLSTSIPASAPGITCSATSGRSTSTSRATASCSPATAAIPGQVARAKDGQWIYLFRPELLPESRARRQELRPARRAARRAAGEHVEAQYRLEPNVSFTPDQKWVVFRSNMFGEPTSLLWRWPKRGNLKESFIVLQLCGFCPFSCWSR